MFGIGDFARLGGVSVRALRFYGEVGLLPPAQIDPASGYRRYSSDQLALLNRILVFKDLGFSLTAIRRLVDQETSLETMRAMLRQRRGDLKRRVGTELDRLARVERRIHRLERGGGESRHEVFVRRTESARVASLREEISDYAEMDALFEKISGQVGDRRIVRGRAAIWHRCAGQGGRIDCEALLLLRRPPTAGRRVSIYELPSATVACLLHQGADETISRAYSSLRRWISENGFRISGSNREVYWRQGALSEGSEEVTEIQFPVEKLPAGKPRAANAA